MKPSKSAEDIVADIVGQLGHTIAPDITVFRILDAVVCVDTEKEKPVNIEINCCERLAVAILETIRDYKEEDGGCR